MRTRKNTVENIRSHTADGAYGRPVHAVVYGLLTVLVLLQLPLPASAQQPGFNPIFETFNLPGGLPGNSVSCIAQDSAGFLWFGSLDGLVRYDGYNHVPFRRDSSKANTLTSNTIEHIFVDRQGVLWLAHGKDAALTAFDPTHETYTCFRHDPANFHSLNGGAVHAVVQDTEGYLWVATDRGIDRLDRRNRTFRHFRHDPADAASLADDYVRTLYIDRAGVLWVGTRGGLSRYDARTERFTHYRHDPANARTLGNNEIWTLFEDSRGHFWVGTRGDGLHRLDRATGAVTRFVYDPSAPERLSRPYFRHVIAGTTVPEGGVSTITEDSEGRLWIGATAGGINVWDAPSNGLWHFELPSVSLNAAVERQLWPGWQYYRLPGRSDLIFPNQIRQVFRARDGSLWITEGRDGAQVYRVRYREPLFRFVETTAFTGKERLLSIAKDPTGAVWMGANKAKTWLVRLNGPERAEFFAPRPNPGPFRGQAIYHLATDRAGNLWVSCSDGLFCRNLATGTFRHYQPAVGSEVSFGPLLEDRQGNIWACGWNRGLFRLDPRTGKFDFFHPRAGEPGSIGGASPWGLLEDRQGHLWVSGGDLASDSTGKPLFIDRLDPYAAQPVFQHFVREFMGLAWGLTEDPTGKVWFADNKSGIRKIDPATGNVEALTRLNKLLRDSTANSINRAPDGKFWISTNEFMFRFDPASGALWTFDLPSGGTGLYSASCQTPDGELLITRREGYLSFYPADARWLEKTRPPAVLITGLKLRGHAVAPDRGQPLRQAIWQTRTLRLAHDQNVFAFSVACLDFHDPAANRIEFMLENYDEHWRHDLLDGNTPPYLNVPPGRYVFRVRGRSSAGVYNFEGAAVEITVLPPWWRTWWAYALYLALAAAAVRVYIVYALRRARRREQEAFEAREMARIRELDTLRTRLYTNITHEFRTPLTIILGMARQTLQHPGQDLHTSQEMIIRNGEQLLRLVNEMLDLSKLESGKMELHAVQADIITALRFIAESFHSLAISKNLEFYFTSTTETLVMDFDPEKIRQIVSNLLSNAIKFTPAGGQVDLVVSGTDSMLTIRVQDNGLGIPPEKQPFLFDRFYQADDSPTRQADGTGIGLALVRELVRFMDGTIRVTSPLPGVSNGAEFAVSLPVRRTAPETGHELQGQSSVPAPVAAADIPPHAAADAPLVLIVEDNSDVVAYLSTCLTHYRIMIGGDGQTGYELAVEHVPDLVISDVMMPVMDGLELCHRLKTDGRTCHIPVVLLTARADFDSRIEGLEQGADVYLAKPFAPEELLVHLKKLLELRLRLRQHYLEVAGLSAAPEPHAPGVPRSSDDAFVRRVREIIEAHLDDYGFSVVQLGHEALLSQRQLYRKLEALTGYTPNAFIRYVRLHKATELLRDPELSVTTVALECGFSDPSYFARVFKQEFGVTPAAWREMA